MKQILIFTFLIVTIFSYGQNSKDFTIEKMKDQPYTIYYEIDDAKWKHLNKKKYYSLDRNGNLKYYGSWEFDSISRNKKIISKIKEIKTEVDVENYNSSKNLSSTITFIKKGHFSGSIAEQKVNYYNSRNKIIKVITYGSEIDTLDIGREQINSGKPISQKNLNYKLNKTYEEHFNELGQLVKLVDLFNSVIFTYKYNSKGEIIEKVKFRFEDEDKLAIYDNQEIPSLNSVSFFDTIHYTYKYDSNGNWIEKKAFYGNTYEHLIETTYREIKYGKK